MSIHPVQRQSPKPPQRFGLTERRRSAAARSRAVDSLQRFVRLEQWNGLAAGDVVRVTGHTPRGRHWRFRAHVTNTSNGASWVEVALVEGSPPSRRPSATDPVTARVEKVRSFEPDLVEARWSRLGRRPRQRLALGEPEGTPREGGDLEPSGSVRVLKPDDGNFEQPGLF